MLGVPRPVIRAGLHDWCGREQLRERPLGIQKDVAYGLSSGSSSEEKIAGILYRQEILHTAGGIRCGGDLRRIRQPFIVDWNLCDWLCVQVQGPLIEQHGMARARAVASCSAAENLW